MLGAHHPVGRDQKWLSEACRLALAFGRSAVVRLRHNAPVGHGFGVPSPDLVMHAWQTSRAAIAKQGGLALAVVAEDGFALPGLTSLLSAIASTPLTPDTLVADTAAEILKTLNPDHETTDNYPWEPA